MKNLAIIAYSRKAVNEYRNLFEKILENRVLISTYCMEDGSIYQPIQADLAVISSDDMLPLAKKQLASGITLVTAALTISRKGFEAIQALPQGTRALMVNVNRNLSLQCVEQIYHLGATHLELIPYTPYTELHQRVDVAISPGEAWAALAQSSGCGFWHFSEPIHPLQSVRWHRFTRRKNSASTAAALLSTWRRLRDRNA